MADLEETICTYERALTVLDRAFLLSPVAYQLGQQGRWAGLTARTVEVHHQAGRPAQALAIAEGSKSRLLTTLLGRRQIPTPATIPGDLAEREQTLVAALVDLDAADLARHGSDAAGDSTLPQRQALVAQLVSLWEEMEEGHRPEASDYVALRRGDSPAYEDLARLAVDLGPDTAILSIFTTGEHTLLFVLQAGMDVPEAVDVALPANELRYTYLANYADEVLNRRAHRAAGRPFTHRWRDLGQRLLARVLPLLEDVTHLVIVPEGPFHLLPIHALYLNPAGETLLDRFTVSYVPALTVLARLLQREPILAREAIVLGYTFLGEAQAVAKQLRVSPLLRKEADAAHVQAALHDRILRLVHLSCHGGFDANDPLRSGVLLADGLFTARQWMELHFRADLVTLSACQTGLSGSLGGDEMAGLSQALLYAGASSLLVGLWSVDARTTAALMVDFYRRLWDENGDKRTDEATALREATLALRDGKLLPPMEGMDPSDPYYWAPFILVGDWR